MPRATQAPPPGIVRNATAEATPGFWFDANNIRWRGGVMIPVGGNARLDNTVVTDLPRDVITWHDNRFQRWAAFGTDTKLYAYCFDTQTLYDITPTGIVVDPIPPPGFVSGYGMGNYSNGVYGISSAKPLANSAGTFGVGTQAFVAGYGLGPYGADIYGVSSAGPPQPPGILATLTEWWSMDTFGELLVVVPTQDGNLYSWDPNTPTTPATFVPNAPDKNRGVIVTDQRQVVLYGAGGDPRKVAWSAQEDMTVWLAAVDNLAGDKQLVTGAAALTACKVAAGILLFTSNDVHLMTYTGPPYAYGITQIAAGCGPISPRAVVGAGSFVAWMSLQNFWMYSGNVQPLPCDVKDWFFSELNPGSAGRLFGSLNPQFAEIWWDFPDSHAANGENNRYLAVNYTAKPYWMIGRRHRTAGDRLGTLDYPILGGQDEPGGTGGALYQHESGYTDNGEARASAGEVFIESGAIALGEGDSRFHVRQVVFDATTDPALTPPFGFRFFAKEEPYDTDELDTGLYTDIHAGLMDVRFSGRSVRMRLEATQDAPFSVGRTRLDMVKGGRR